MPKWLRFQIARGMDLKIGAWQSLWGVSAGPGQKRVSRRLCETQFLTCSGGSAKTLGNSSGDSFRDSFLTFWAGKNFESMTPLPGGRDRKTKNNNIFANWSFSNCSGVFLASDAHKAPHLKRSRKLSLSKRFEGIWGNGWVIYGNLRQFLGHFEGF